MEEEEAEPHGHHTHIMHQYMVRNVWLRISAEYRFQQAISIFLSSARRLASARSSEGVKITYSHLSLYALPQFQTSRTR